LSSKRLTLSPNRVGIVLSVCIRLFWENSRKRYQDKGHGLMKQFTSFPLFFLFTAFILPLFIFFVFAVFFQPSFFIFLSLSLVVIILYLLFLRKSLLRKKSDFFLHIQNYEEQKNLLEVEIQQEKQVIISCQEKIINASSLKDMMEKLSMCLSLEDTSKTFSAEVNKLFGDEETTIILYLFHSKTGDLGLSSSKKGQMRVNIKTKKGDIFDQWVVRVMQPLLIEDTHSDYRFDIDKIVVEDARPIRSLVSVPLMVGNKALGILRIDSPEEKHFSTEDLRFLTTISDLGAVAIENAQLYECVEQLAIKDSLTDLYLRRYLLERIPKEISRHLRYKTELSFLIFDLDNFKTYNDKFGHIAGDIVLRTFAMILDGAFKEPGELVCRYGGEEFCVLLPDCSKEKALALAQEVRKKIESQTILLRREKTRVTVSVGVATFPIDAHNTDDIIHKADMALYKAKQKGRNRVEAAE